ncbi:MAG: hypothetical protein LBC92_03185 [Rickettsiales bacterium]|jgi:hypothetical protein|nr:hypothetical protein [Rickettsiales bacterium]
MDDDIEKKIERRIKKLSSGDNKNINWFKIQGYLTIGIRSFFTYVLCFLLIGRNLLDYFGHSYSYLFSFIIGTIINIYLIVRLIKH